MGWLLLAAALGFGALGFGHGFVWDDQLLLASGAGFDAPWWHPFLHPFFSAAGGAAGFYRPLSTLLQSLGLAVTPGSPLGIQILATLLHGGATLGLWRLLRRWVPDSPGWIAIAALLFALAPLHGESIWWASAVSVPLHACGLCLALAGLPAPGEDRSRTRASWVLVGLLVALLAKDNAATYPLFCLGLVAWLPSMRDDRRRLALACLVPWVLWVGLRLVAFGSWDAGLGRSVVDPQFDPLRKLSLALELFGAGFANALVPLFPELLRPIAPHWVVRNVQGLSAVAGLSVFLLLCIRAWRTRSPRLLLAVLGVLACLAPLTLFPNGIGRYPLADRQLYVLVGILAGLSAGTLARWGHWQPALRRPLAVAWLALLVGALWLSVQRAPTWRDNLALFTQATYQNPASAMGWNALGRAALERYRADDRIADLALSRQAYDRSMDLAVGIARLRLAELGQASAPPRADERQVRAEQDWIATSDLIDANLGLGWCLLYEAERDAFHDFAAPRALFERLIQAAPENSDARSALAVAQFMQGERETALASLREALNLAPEDASLHRQAARIEYSLGEFDAARRHAEHAVELDPRNPEGPLWLGRAELELGHLPQARTAGELARKLAPSSSSPEVLLGMVAGRAQGPEAALDHFEAALRLNPDDAQAHAQRGKALYQTGQVEAALGAWRSATELDGGLFEPQYNLASELLRLGQNDAARPYLRRAYANCPDKSLRSLMRGTLVGMVREDAATLRSLAAVDRRRDRDSALEWARLATETEPTGAANWELLGTLLHAAGQPLDAVEAFDRARSLGAKGFLFERARALALSDANLPEAPAALEHALSLLPPPTGEQAALLASYRDELEQRLAEQPVGPPAPR